MGVGQFGRVGTNGGLHSEFLEVGLRTVERLIVAPHELVDGVREGPQYPLARELLGVGFLANGLDGVGGAAAEPRKSL